MAAIPRICRFAAAAMLLAAAALAQAQVARVIETRGASMVERTGQPPRLLGIGEGLDQRDTIHVARDSWAVLEFSDRTRITLRPDTVFRIDAYSDNAPESVLMGLVKGGFRAVTGLIGKRNPRAVAFGTPYATIGIRGTEFDARLCGDDCGAEDRRALPSTRPAGPAARLLSVRGDVGARDLWGRMRTLATGNPVDVAEEVRTGPRGSAVLQLRDGGRIALGPRTRFEIRRFVYDPARPAAAIAEFELHAGSIRTSTGAIGKARPVGYRIFTKVGQIGTRGTEVVVNCTANCETPPDAAVKPPPPPPPPALGNVGEIRLPNGVVLETRVIGSETRLVQRLPSQGEPIGTLPDGTPLYANPATAVQQDNVEWVLQDGYLAPRAAVRDGSTAQEGVRVSAVVVRDGVLQVLSEPPYLANETARIAYVSNIQTVNPDGTISRSDAVAAHDAANLDSGQPITLADGSQMHVFQQISGGADLGNLNQFVSTLLSERAETVTAQPPPPPPPPPPPLPPATAPALGNVGEIRLPNGVVLETRVIGGETRLVQRLPSQGEPIGTLPDGTPLYADPATALQQNTVEWVYQDGTFFPRAEFSLGLAALNGTAVGVSAVVVRDGVLQVLSEPPYLADETARNAGVSTIQTVNPDGTISRSDPGAVRDAIGTEPITMADGSQMHLFQSGSGGADLGSLNQFVSTLLSERAETVAAQTPPPGLKVSTVEGTVSVETPAQTTDVPAGQTGSVSPDGNVTTVATTGTPAGPALPPAEPPAPTTPPVDSTEPGLYTWVRDGAITLEKDGTTIEVPAGSAALAGETVLRLLASVPDFLRLDPTPLPDPESLKQVSIFTAPDGSTFGSCRVQ